MTSIPCLARKPLPSGDVSTQASSEEDVTPTTTPFCSFIEFHQQHRARCTRFYLKHTHVDTPIFMPVGTYGVMKGIQPDIVSYNYY